MATYYVETASNGGGQAGSDGSLSKPWLWDEFVGATLAQGDRIEVGPGAHDANATLDLSAGEIVIVGDDTDRPVIVAGSALSQMLKSTSGAEYVAQNLMFDGNGFVTGTGFQADNPSFWNLVDNIRVTDCNRGFSFARTKMLSRCRADNNAEDGFYRCATNAACCTADNNGGDGFSFFNADGIGSSLVAFANGLRGVVTNNYIYATQIVSWGNTGDGINVGGAGERGNAYAFSIFDSTTIMGKEFLISFLSCATTSGQIPAGVSVDEDNIVVSAPFVDAENGDFTLTAEGIEAYQSHAGFSAAYNSIRQCPDITLSSYADLAGGSPALADRVAALGGYKIRRTA